MSQLIRYFSIPIKTPQRPGERTSIGVSFFSWGCAAPNGEGMASRWLQDAPRCPHYLVVSVVVVVAAAAVAVAVVVAVAFAK